MDKRLVETGTCFDGDTRILERRGLMCAIPFDGELGIERRLFFVGVFNTSCVIILSSSLDRESFSISSETLSSIPPVSCACVVEIC